MANTRLKETKDGRRFYEIRCRPSRDRAELTTRWYVPDGWSARSIERELKKKVAAFEQKISSGEIQTRKELQAEKEKEELEAARILTLKQYGERVFMPAKSVSCSENTRSSFQSILNLHIYPVLGSIKMPDVTTAQISALLLDFQNNHAHASTVKVYTHMQVKKAKREPPIFSERRSNVHKQRPGGSGFSARAAFFQFEKRTRVGFCVGFCENGRFSKSAYW